MSEPQSSYDVAVGTAFRRSDGATAASGPRTLRIRRAWLAFVVGFPGVLGAVLFASAWSRTGMDDGAFPVGLGLLGIAVVLLILGVASRLSFDDDGLAVRFFGLRTTSVRFADLSTATFGMVFPSISFAVTLADQGGRRAVVHANWWDDEPAVMSVVCRALLRDDVAVDRATATIIARVLRVKAPVARVAHRPWREKKRRPD